MTNIVPFVCSEQGQILGFTYTNWKGETRQRQAMLKTVFFGSNEYHKEPQWLVKGWDVEKEAQRTYALKDITNVENIT